MEIMSDMLKKDEILLTSEDIPVPNNNLTDATDGKSADQPLVWRTSLFVLIMHRHIILLVLVLLLGESNSHNWHELLWLIFPQNDPLLFVVRNSFLK